MREIRKDLWAWVVLVSMVLTLGAVPRSSAQEIAPTGIQRRHPDGPVDAVPEPLRGRGLRQQL